MSSAEPASLTARLLVKKGGAKPAGFNGPAANENGRANDTTAMAAQVAAGWAAAAALNPDWAALLAANPSEQSQFAAQPEKPAKSNARSRLTLRLDADRHLRLKLTAAHMQVSLQELVTAAIDAYLNDVSSQLLNGKCTCITMPGAARQSDRRK